MRQEKAKDYLQLLCNSIKALFVLSDEQCRAFNWYYQELYYIKLISFLDDSLDYVHCRPKVFENNVIFDTWLTKLQEGREQVFDMLSQDELLYFHYRRVRAAHMFQDAYEYDDEEMNKSISVRIIQKNGQIKNYSRLEAEEAINRVHRNYHFSNSRELDLYYVHKLEPVLTKLRLELNEITSVPLKFGTI